jgi:endonuclease YncB( thermonuclease family)
MNIMRTDTRVSILGVLAVALLVSGAAVAGHAALTGKCVKVVDGDTLIIDCDDGRRTVELAGIDAPELEQPWGKEVKSFVRDMVRGREVGIEVVDVSEETIRARITVDGRDLSEMLVGRGLAWVPEEAADAELSKLSAEAREKPCGLWTDTEPKPPWEFRHSRS